MLEKYPPPSPPPDSTSYMAVGAYAKPSPHATYLGGVSDIETGPQSIQFIRDATDPANTGRDIGMVLGKIGRAVSRLGRYIHRTLTLPGAVAEPLASTQEDVTAEFREASNSVEDQLSVAHSYYESGDYTAALKQLTVIPSHSDDRLNYPYLILPLFMQTALVMGTIMTAV